MTRDGRALASAATGRATAVYDLASHYDDKSAARQQQSLTRSHRDGDIRVTVRRKLIEITQALSEPARIKTLKQLENGTLNLNIMVARPPTGDACGHAGKQMLSRPYGKAASTAWQQASTAAATGTGTDKETDTDTDTDTDTNSDSDTDTEVDTA
jgi:hypothetical protein